MRGPQTPDKQNPPLVLTVHNNCTFEYFARVALMAKYITNTVTLSLHRRYVGDKPVIPTFVSHANNVFLIELIQQPLASRKQPAVRIY